MEQEASLSTSLLEAQGDLNAGAGQGCEYWLLAILS
jgi:hypothetical protein